MMDEDIANIEFRSLTLDNYFDAINNSLRMLDMNENLKSESTTPKN